MAQLLLAAPSRSSGKTTITLGLAGALRARGLSVQAFKKGPDYIDPMWLSRASGRAAYNLDFNTQSREEITALFAAKAAGADLALIETNMSLFDGSRADGRDDSNAALAKLLRAPVVLVVDCKGMARGIAPLLLGYANFDPELAIAGVILNRVGGPRHEKKLRAAVREYTDIPVLGAVAADSELAILERHLGLATPGETRALDQKIARIVDVVGRGLDLDRLVAIARAAPLPAPPSPPLPESPSAPLPAAAAGSDATQSPASAGRPVRIAIARDTAFGFYYPDDLEAFEAAGAALIPFNACTDPALPECDGLFIGGGFPETQMAALEANQSLREDVRRKIEAGLPAYAECGGLMYLCRAIVWQGARAEMAGVIAADAVMHPRPQGRGYVRLRERAEMPWPRLPRMEAAEQKAAGDAAPGLAAHDTAAPKSATAEPAAPAPEYVAHELAAQEFAAHEFHYAGLEATGEAFTFAYDVLRGAGIDGAHDGIVYRNLLAGFAHLRQTRDCPWVARFIAFVRRCART